ncbi:hypothetical protein AC579_5235 [Pseudocercospora musae]|uniref:Ketosynthase family 3 (KS3) domain-containing protein n=1 Tax=Pseudocercospora musae TaxID=113226 RepID=A0A139IQ63_9PEZI|nr:hypothetical protein AC579_5235 [Pseudocercospora musae]
MAASKLFVFGSQSLDFDTTSFARLRAKLHAEVSCSWLLDVLKALPAALAAFVAFASKPHLADMHRQLDVLLETLLHAGDVPYHLFPLPNALLSPLVVVSHLADYVALVKTVEPTWGTRSHNIPTCFTADAEWLGLCVGELSALAVACSASFADLAHHGAVSVRLAMLSGALVDAEDASRDPATKSASFSVTWTGDDGEELNLVLRGFADAYVSVRMDEKRATVTCAQIDVTRIQELLRRSGMSMSGIALKGRFHWPPHRAAAEDLNRFISSHSDFRVDNATRTLQAMRNETGERYLRATKSQETALRAILTDQANWYQTMDTLYTRQLHLHRAKVISFGTERCLPPTIARKLGTRLIHVRGDDLASSIAAMQCEPEDRIAIIGMACNLPNAEDVDSFWQILLSGQSQHREIPRERFTMNSLARKPDPTTKWYGNFLTTPDVFDHKFFKKSPREMASTDPQHRIALQLAYQALQQSGYFRARDVDRHTGVYIGHANTDYEHNIRCYPANAYSATGNLKRASFLSPTGQCKPFDAKADGYCRGEGSGLVFMKRLSTALADGDQIIGVVAATSVLQNQNYSPITVPNSTSLVDLFQGVLKRADMTPHEITLVEAHGTGTAVGDPAELPTNPTWSIWALIRSWLWNYLLECITTAMGADEDRAVPGGTSSLSPKESRTAMCNGASSDDGAKLVDGANGNSAPGDADSDTSYDSLFPPSTVLNVVRAVTAVTDEFVMEHKLGNYYNQVRPRSTMLCAAYIVEAFEKLGCSIKGASPGQRLATTQHLPKHDRFMKELYKIVGPQETGLVEIIGDSLIRTSIRCPDRSASELLQSALQDEPDHAPEFQLVALTGCKLAECLTGEADGLHLLFGTAEGRKILSDVYAVAPINYTWIKQATLFVQLLLRSLPATHRHINILELGAGTGGTTAAIVPMLAALSMPVTYTFTDLSSSLVAAARRRFKQYPFMKFQVLDIESAPEKSLVHTQHIVLANACVHATRSLPVSVHNIHGMLCPDGMLILLEETEQLPWVDFALHWEQVLRDAGFGHVEYTDGKLRMAQVQRIMFGFASDIRYGAVSSESRYSTTLSYTELTSLEDRQKVIDDFLRYYTSDFAPPGSTEVSPLPVSLGPQSDVPISGRLHILVTGATGSLGSHLAAAAARMPHVRKVTCLNRLGSVDAETRQWEAFSMRGIKLEAGVLSKFETLSADTTKPMLGLSHELYETLVPSLTHIIHSAWPMSLTRTTKAYEPQFRTMRSLIDLACKCAGARPRNFQFGFQFISSIGTVGYYPLWTGRSLVPETMRAYDRDDITYCPRTIPRYEVRLAQITGSRSNGHWNPFEHFPFLIKSAQFLKSIPDLRGTLSWFPVDDVASALLDILLASASPWPVYHIENPVRQPWSDMIGLLAQELGVPPEGIVPYEQWIETIRACDAPLSENPAKQIPEFWQKHFLRMSTGPLVLSTIKSCEHSEAMRDARPVEDGLALHCELNTLPVIELVKAVPQSL